MISPSPSQWALCMPRAGLGAAGCLRLKRIEACIEEANAWLRGSEPLEELHRALQSLPGSQLFIAGPDGVLTPLGHRVPAARLPEGPWTPLAQALRVGMGAGLLPGAAPSRVELRLEHSATERDANVLVASPQSWTSFANEASIHRLRPLKFALSASRALLWGNPLPSIPGTRYFESHGIAAPCGWQLAPIHDTELVRAALSLAEGDFALFHEDGSFEKIDACFFTAATRAAVRLAAQIPEEAAP